MAPCECQLAGSVTSRPAVICHTGIPPVGQGSPPAGQGSECRNTAGRMRVVSWNINGIRATRGGLQEILDSLDADIICLQETKVTRDLLDEPTAIVEGYNSYFCFSRARSGYSGVATFCKSRTTPWAAEEGLSGLLTNHRGSVGCYGNTEGFVDEELQSLDQEGRAVLTQHHILTSEDREETLTVINVYCPRADPEKPERKSYKLRFYRLLQIRAEAILQAGGHVIVLGDVNTSHRPLDHCDPTDLEVFEENPGRQWLNQFLGEPVASGVGDPDSAVTPGRESSGRFLDSFRYFHPAQKNAFTCWSSASGARQTNYGTRIDYILGDRGLVETQFLDSILLPEVEGSDHCPVKAVLRCRPVPAARCPPLCTKYLPEFAGRQQKLSQFLVRKDRDVEGAAGAGGELPESRGSGEGAEHPPVRKRAQEAVRGKAGKKSRAGAGSLLSFFKPVGSRAAPAGEGRSPRRGGEEPSQGRRGAPAGEERSSDPARCARERAEGTTQQDPLPAPLVRKESQAAFWKSVLRGPAPPPSCKGHGEACVLRTVKKAGPTCGRQFYVCARPAGHSSNPQARCNFFLWVTKKTGCED
ncbi:hypothetical protein FKM82_027181 [Ascaphus truei]